jgi:hypothetical protein
MAVVACLLSVVFSLVAIGFSIDTFRLQRKIRRLQERDQ